MQNDHEDFDRDWRPEAERGDTGFRILYSIFFAIVYSLVEALMTALVIFQLAYSLVTEQAPSERVRDFGNRLCTYAYQLFRYLTHNSSERPFPFADFPEALEPAGWPYAPRPGRKDSDHQDSGDQDYADEDPLPSR
jgi:hypothetical protein